MFLNCKRLGARDSGRGDCEEVATMKVATRALTAVVLLGIYGLAWGKTINVPADYATIQAAVDAAVAGDVVVLAAGTYPVGFTVNKAITVRSVNPADAAVVATTKVSDNGIRDFAVDLSGGGIVDGLTITSPEGRVSFAGAGTVRRCQMPNTGYSLIVVNGNSQPLIENNVLQSHFDHPAVDCRDTSAPIIRNNLFSNSGGGAVFAGPDSKPQILGNTMIHCGSATQDDCVVLYDGEVIGNVFRNCSTPGATVIVYGAANISNNLIVGCTINGSSGAISCTGPASITNNTISDCWMNSSQQHLGAGIFVNNASPIIRNCLITFGLNSAGIMLTGTGSPQVSYCDFYGNSGAAYVGFTPSGPGNLSLDPQYADRDATTGAYRLKSAGGRWDGSAWVNDAVSSPCIDAGDPAAAYSGEPTPNGSRVNMGYDGNTRYASKTAPPVITVCTPKGTGILCNCKIVVRFSAPMKPATVQNAFYLNGVKVTTGTFAWLGTKMTYTPATNWRPNKRYQCKITTAVRSKAGLAMAADKIWNFTTGLTAPAMITASASPTTAGAQITLNLTAAADVTITVRNLAGREIAILQPGQLDGGVHSLLWNGTSRAGTKVPAGMYLIEASAHGANGASTKQVTSLRM